MNSIPVKFACGELTLEGEWLFPDAEGQYPGVVITHPFPPMGGSMHNSVVTAIWENLARNSIAALRFNFRGTGESEGTFEGGSAEIEDVRAALDFASSYEGIDTARVGLAGYSFGAMMALPVGLRDERVKGMALASAPFSDSQWEKLREYKNPKLFVIGGEDQMIPLEDFRRQVMKSPDPESYQIIPGADHSFMGYETEVAGLFARFFTGVFG
jgi:alpha/beta superfamily hydrolase